MGMCCMDKAVLHGIAREHLDKVWDLAAPMVDRALEYADGKYNLEAIYEALAARDMQLWVATLDFDIVAVCVTEIRNYPCKKILTIFASAGWQLDSWLDFLTPILEWGKAQGCNASELYGRPGWERVLDRFGFEKIHTVLRLKL
jgi:hypothetical protein